ncbi:two-component sensor histidine kinase [Bacterioplanes sanyensis]|uniref:ATP-binding protein n=1 Tax=Bacterioplanes sanyensis TaxID=1249553 RepID=UPI001675A68C|nr:ATP-binding protein [Bacterioplanes sanyensis]GGY50933.1 two-component sensor histidine kinase [Bacterioplanes sanyensis]
MRTTRWYRSLFFKVFFWFWSVIFLAMLAAVVTSDWIGDDYFRQATPREQMHLIRLLERKPPIIAEDRKLWRKLRPGWNLVAVASDRVRQLPHDVEEFVDAAEESGRILWGQDDGWLMIGPVARGDYLYVAISRQQWGSFLEDEHRWMVPVAVVAVVTLLCFTLVWSLTRPIRRLQRAARQLAQGNFDVSGLRADEHRHDEIGALSGEVIDMAAALQRLLQSHQQLLRDVSHELRSPLTRLQIALGIARKKDQQDALATEHDRIERAVAQVDGLVGQILDLARLQQQDSRALLLEEDDVDSRLDDWLSDAAIEIDDKQLRLQRQNNPVPLTCEWDWVLIERAFDNILRNAIRFAPEHSELLVALESDGDWVNLAVADQGPGVPDDELQRIFDPFTQVDSARDHASGGYGIGLALVKRIVELHDGMIRAENRSPGLQITIRLPRKINH